ncbi:MAG: hypothetical protein AAGC70_18330 [Pseudomonadota bacterium]
MLATRALFLGVNLVLWVLNGWVLLQELNILSVVEGALIGALIANMVSLPVIMWSAYRTGQLVEETYRGGSET